MKPIYYSLAAMFFVFALISCGKEDNEIDYAYHIHIHSPDITDKHLGDTLQIKIDFESQTEETLHHINVQIADLSGAIIVFDQPAQAHIHHTDGKLTFEESFVLSNENGVGPHSDWELIAKAWAHSADEGLVIEKIQFHVHP